MRKLLFLFVLFACQPTKSGSPLPVEPPQTPLTPVGATLSPKSTSTQKTMRDRQAFAQKLSSIKAGTPTKEIKELLGEPDDIRTSKDGIVTTNTSEVWCYGADAHLAFPTLAWVYIDNKQQAQYIYGGSPLTANLPPETELVPLLKMLDQIPELQGYKFHPQPLIAAVNALQPLGKEKALAVISEYLRVSSDFDSPAREGTFLLMRALFDVPADPGYMPTMFVGGPSPQPPKDPKVFPRFPLSLEGDVPLLLVSGYILAGKAQDPEEHIKYFTTNGVFRSSQLKPTDTPSKILQTLVDSFPDTYGKKTTEGAMLADQLLSLLAPVYQSKESLVGNAAWWDEWKKAAALKLHWDATTQRYVAN
jgi:hypothetical protein